MGGEGQFSMEYDHLVAGVPSHPCAGWDERFRLMAERGDDHLLDEEAVNQSAGMMRNGRGEAVR